MHDLDALASVAVTETGRALGASRCFIRLGEPEETLPIRAEWRLEGLEPIGEGPSASRSRTWPYASAGRWRSPT